MQQPQGFICLVTDILPCYTYIVGYSGLQLDLANMQGHRMSHTQVRIASRKNLGWGRGPGHYLEIAQHEVPCDFLEGAAHCTWQNSEHQASIGVWLKLAFSLLSY